MADDKTSYFLNISNKYLENEIQEDEYMYFYVFQTFLMNVLR